MSSKGENEQLSFFSNNFADLDGKQFCRTCLVLCDTFSINTFKFDGISLKTILTVYANVEINENSRLPHTMCKLCIRKLYGTHYFLSQCRSSELLLQSMLGTVQTENPNTVTSTETNNVIDDLFKEEPFQNNDYTSDISDSTVDLDKMTRETKNNSQNITSKQSKHRMPLYYISSDPKCLDQYKIKWPDPPPYICKGCDKCFESTAKLAVHKRESRHRRGYNYMCPYCKKRFFAPSVLLPHLRTHTKEKPLQCSVCPRQFRERSILLRHMRTHCYVKPYVCKQCGNGYTRSAYLRDHIRSHEGLICKFCGKGFETGNALINHERWHLRKNFRLENYNNKKHCPLKRKLQFTCEICGNILSTKRSLEIHVAEHGSKDLKCEHCNKKFATNSRKMTHIKYVHSEKACVCYHCGKTYNKYVLKDHLRTHTENAYCKVCDKNFTLMSSYETHMRLHNGNAETLCNICNRYYSRKQSLKVHMQSHGEWRYACEKCNKRFFDEKSFKRHTQNCSRIK